MQLILAFLMFNNAADLSEQYNRDFQACIIDTSKLWASKPGEPAFIVQMAEVYCHRKLDLFLIAQSEKNKKLGLTNAASDEYNAILGATLLRLARGFAIEAVQKARSK